MTSQPPPSTSRLRETLPCPDCGGLGVTDAAGKTLREFYGPATCEGCAGEGEVVRCDRCGCLVAASEAESDYGMCTSCRIDAETADTEREYARVARWSQ